jgi:hypothetical protein
MNAFCMFLLQTDVTIMWRGWIGIKGSEPGGIGGVDLLGCLACALDRVLLRQTDTKWTAECGFVTWYNIDSAVTAS